MPAAGGFFRAQVLMLWLEIAADFYVYSRNRKSSEISLRRGQHSEGSAYKRCIVGYRWMGGSKEPTSSAKAAGLARGQTSSRGRSRHLTRLSHVLMLPTCPPCRSRSMLTRSIRPRTNASAAVIPCSVDALSAGSTSWLPMRSYGASYSPKKSRPPLVEDA